MAVQLAENRSALSSSEVLAAHARLPEHVVYRTFVRETVVLDLVTGRYHGTDPIGGRILDLLVDGATPGVAAQALAEEYGLPLAEAERNVCRFCTDLHERGLIEMSLDGSR
jgi:Coenzyme PQQ synthesis protein D (PqqD)